MFRVSLLALSLVLTACETTTNPGGGGTSVVEDTSTGGLVAASIGGALANNLSVQAGSKSSKTLTSALNPCPTLLTLEGPYCTKVDDYTVNLVYIQCHLADSMAQWTGVLQIADASGISCGTVPTTTMSRQFVTSTTDFTPGGGLRVANGLTVTLDHRTANLGNYQGDVISPNVGTGYGEKTIWNNNVRTGVELRQRIYSSGLFDHSVAGSVAISESAGATTRTASGSVTVYHNILRVKGVSTLSSLVFSNNCCTPTAGSITTTFASTTQSGAAGRALDGKSETIQFTGCGTATVTGVDGTSANVSITQCY